MIEVIPCAPGAHIGEMITLGYLREHLPGDNLVLTNYHLPDQGGTLEIDLVMINYRGVFLLEVKHWWGPIEADQIHWLQARHAHPSPLTKIDMKAKRVHSTLIEAYPGLYRVSVVGFVVLSKGDTLLTIDDPRRDRVFPLRERLIEALTGTDYLHSPSSLPLDRPRLKAVAEALLRQHVDPEHRIVGSYRIVEELAPGALYEAYEAQHVTIGGRRARLKKYHIPAVQSQKHLEASVRQFKQDMEALSQVEGHPNIVRAYDFFKDPDVDDTYYLALELVEGRLLREIIDEDEDIPLEQGIRYLIPVADALATCHRRGIIHRNLTPQSITVTEQGQIKLGDFDFARVPAIGQTISKTGQPLVVNKYIAPEQLVDARQVDARADIYSLGAVWYDLIFRRPEDEPVRLALIAGSDLPDDARQLLRGMLAPRPDDRPDLAEVREWFELLAG
ncbi:MAG: protein kinase [Anaerolineae bacterium]|nr:protein kinase [Anaerolineae bacterium]